VSQSSSHRYKGPLIWPLALVIIGGLLLVGNFLLLEEFNILDLWPLLLVILGAQVLLRGDLVPDDAARPFGITRGSVESATLEINAGEIDVDIADMPDNTERLIAGQYAADSRPALDVDNLHAHLMMQRSDTPWLSFADWQMQLSPYLPWQLVMSSSFGQVTLDLQALIIQNALVSTGVGDIHMVAPYEAFEALYCHSTLGSVYLTTPPGFNVRVSVEGGRFFGVQVDETRYDVADDDETVFYSLDPDDDAPMVDIVVRGTFGDVYLQ
jgi:hypothetical protein